MHRSAILCSAPSTTPLAWLASLSLKVSQLQRIAQATGIQSSGPKSALVQRLQTELPRCALRPPPQIGEKQKNGDGRGGGGVGDGGVTGMSILSIDMGIQNLAFAHLLVREEPSADLEGAKKGAGHPRPLNTTLNAWHRLAVSKIPVNSSAEEHGDGLPSSDSFFSLSSLLAEGKSTTPSYSSSADQNHKAAVTELAEADTSATSPSKENEREIEKGLFPIHLYAARAYTLITTLLDTYKPTHVLIERQRFRSGGASAVQEWTLRVGVFEGMLYALLHALKQESKLSTTTTAAAAAAPSWSRSQVEVHGIEPQRVARYWLDEVPTGEERERTGPDGDAAAGGGTTGSGTGKGRRKLTTSREGKKAKIDIIGKLLLSSAIEMTEKKKKTTKAGISLDVEKNTAVQTIVKGYLYKWQGGKNKKQVKTRQKTKNDNDNDNDQAALAGTLTGSYEQVAASLIKLDDLADSLLQGLTWLDWQVMRDRFSREGLDALRLGEEKGEQTASSAFRSSSTSTSEKKDKPRPRRRRA